MPNIVEYKNPIKGLQPNGIGAEAFASSGYRIDAFAKQAGEDMQGGIDRIAVAGKQVADQIDNHMTMTQVSQLSAGYAGATAQWTQQWNDIASHTDPNNIQQARTDFINKVVQPGLEKLQGDNLTDRAQAFAQDHAADVLSHFTDKTAADASVITGQALVANLGQTADSAVQAVRADPTSMGLAIKNITSSINAQIAAAHGLDGQQAEEARTSVLKEAQAGIVRAGISAAMDKNLAYGESLLNNSAYSKYLSPEAQTELEQYAKMTARANQTDARLAASEAREAKLQQSQNTMSQIYSGFVQPDGSIKIPPNTAAKILSDPNMTGADKVAMINFTEGQALARASSTVPTVSDPTTFTNTLSTIIDGKGTVADVLNGVKNGALSEKDSTYLIKTINDMQKNPQVAADNKALTNFFQTYKGYVDTSTPLMPNAQTQQRWGEFQSDKFAQFQQGIAAGIPAKDLLDPNNKNFIGSDINKYQIPYDPKAPVADPTQPVAPLPPVNTGVTYKPGMSMDDLAKALAGNKQ
jgi:hypothetical protein